MRYYHRTPFPPFSLQWEFPSANCCSLAEGTNILNVNLQMTQTDCFPGLLIGCSFSTWSPLLEMACLRAFWLFVKTRWIYFIFKRVPLRGFAAMWFTFGCRYRSIEETHLNILKFKKGAISHLKGAEEKKIQTFSFSATVELADISETMTS